MTRTQGFTDKAAEEDLFQIKSYTDGLSEFIKVCNTPMTISIQGSWGTGKTSIMNFIERNLKDAGNIEIVKFNTWQFSQFNLEDQLAISFITSMIKQIKLSPEDSKGLEKMAHSLAIVGKGVKSFGATALGVAASTATAGMIKTEDVKDVIDKLTSNENKDIATAISDLKEEFEKCIKASLAKHNNNRIIFFIDDLDRLEPRKAVELLEVMKLFFDVENCIFVLAIDYDVVIKGVADKYGRFYKDEKENLEKGKSFFDKIIQVPFKMPVGKYDIDNYVKQCFADIGVPCTNDKELEKYVDLINCSVGNNPRSMKRLFNAFLLVTKIVEPSQLEKKKSKQLLFAVLCMQYSFESFYNYILSKRNSLTGGMLKQWADPEWDISQMDDVVDLSDVDIDKLKVFMQKFFEAVDYSVDGVSDGRISEEELNLLKSVLGDASVTGSAHDQDTIEQNAKQRKKYAFIYNGEIYESGTRRGRNLGNLGHALIRDAAKVLGWSKSDAEKFREVFLSKGSTGWLKQTIMFNDEVKMLSCGLIDDMPSDYRGVKQVVCIPRFKESFFSYMGENDIAYDEQRAKDDYLTVKLSDSICFVARFWGYNDLERLQQTLAEVFNYEVTLNQRQ